MEAVNVADSLERVAAEVRACTRCDLYRGTINGVPGEGPEAADIMLVGEGPGFNEDKQGRPFVGAAGKFLEELLGIAGLTSDDVFITNVTKHRPAQNRDPEPQELAACRPYLDRQIALLNPKLIVTLGRFSLATFFPGNMISRVHGQVREQEGKFFFHMYHPAAALHQQALRDTLLADMRKLTDFIQGPFARALQTTSDAAVAENSPEQLNLF